MLQKNNRYKVLKVFLDFPTSEFGLRELSRKVGISAPSVKKYLLEFGEKGIVEVIEVRGNPIYIANRDSENFKFYMRLSTQYELFASGLIDFIWKNVSPEAIVFYGGYFKGDATEESDIDLFAIGKKCDLDLSKYERIFGKEIHLMVNELNKIPKELKNNLINGIVMRGYLKILI
ncbi:MAG: nucleotidyltransferase domain-containing protein [Nanoarchaeota archaeon]|nr:nucleotidyltransferase domain-containing protein [Nanoarchaeota archaeon]